MSTPAETPHEGTVIDGRYRVIGRLGAGGMADVYCAEDLQLGRRVALKLLYRRFAEDEAFVERFRREASHAAGLQHPNVVSVYDRGSWGGTYYIAMEYVEGRSLKDVIVGVDPPAPLPVDEAIDVTIQILRAARFAHQRGIVHRDLKPHNVIVDESDPSTPRVKVTDFGIARAGASDMTETGSIMGTAQYLSPEQAQGHATGPASDIYSIGVILYELVTGRVPFDGDSAVSVALKQVTATPVRPSQINPEVTPELEAAIMTALAKDPAARHADAEAFIQAIERVRSGLITGAPPVAAAAPVAPVTHEPALGVSVPGWNAEAAEPPSGQAGASEPSGTRAWRWALLLGLLVVGVIVGALLLSSGSTVDIPDVVGKTRAEATQQLQAVGLNVVAVRENGAAPRDEVVAQDPGAGEQAKRVDTVRLTVSDGPGTVTVPDVVALGRSDALRALRAAGLEIDERTAFDPETLQNRVISQRPEGGTVVAGGTKIVLTVSRGSENVRVPSVVGLSSSAALATLRDAGLTVTRTEEEVAGAEAGTVLRQTPGSGVSVRRGSRVELVVAKAAAKVKIPDVTGREESSAAQQLRGAGLDVKIVTSRVDSPEADGLVQAQTPTGEVDKGSTVTITVGRFDPALDPEATVTTPTATTPSSATTPGADTP